MIEAIKVPEIGENVESGVVVAVHVKPGDALAVDDTVIELETDKALVEIPSPFSGRVIEVLAKAGAQMNVGDVIARVETEAQDHNAVSPHLSGPPEPNADATPTEAAKSKNQTFVAKSATDTVDQPEAAEQTQDEQKDRPSGPDTAVGPERRPAPAAPSIRRIARELGVDIHDISGSGPGGRITEKDVTAAVKHQLTTTSDRSAATGASESGALPDFNHWGTVDIETLQTVRRLTAQSTAVSWRIIPHVTQFDEADITGVMAFVANNKRLQSETDGVRPTLTAVITRFSAEALKRFPRFNASIDVAGNRILLKRYIHIGIAADTPRGLLVPVLRHADQLSLLELAEAIADLAKRARTKRLKPDEMEGGTFTISNQGSIGGTGFTPIVMWPQVAILGVSRASVKPVHVQGRFEPRTVLPLSLSYDHRIIDGADAARFLRWICEGLEQPLNLFLE